MSVALFNFVHKCSFDPIVVDQTINSWQINAAVSICASQYFSTRNLIYRSTYRIINASFNSPTKPPFAQLKEYDDSLSSCVIIFPDIYLDSQRTLSYISPPSEDARGGEVWTVIGRVRVKNTSSRPYREKRVRRRKGTEWMDVSRRNLARMEGRSRRRNRRIRNDVARNLIPGGNLSWE